MSESLSTSSMLMLGLMSKSSISCADALRRRGRPDGHLGESDLHRLFISEHDLLTKPKFVGCMEAFTN